MRNLTLIFVINSAVAWSSAATTVCHSLLALPIEHGLLECAAQAPELRDRLPEMIQRQTKLQDAVEIAGPAIADAEALVATLESAKPRWERILEIPLYGIPLSRRALRAIAVNQERHRLSRTERADRWALEDLNREIERLVFDELITRRIHYETLIGWRDAHAAMVGKSEDVIRQIQTALSEVERAKSDTWTQSSGEISYLGKRTTMRITPAIAHYLKLSADLQLSDESERIGSAWHRFVESPSGRRLDTVATRLIEVKAAVSQLGNITAHRRRLLQARIDLITNLVCGYVELAENPVNTPSSAP